MRYGYARVSSDAQDYAAQVEALKDAGCERVYSEKASGKSRDGRPEFSKLMKALLPGDAVVVTKLDRLARSSRDRTGATFMPDATRAVSGWPPR